jgi:hypothetical protein
VRSELLLRNRQVFSETGPAVWEATAALLRNYHGETYKRNAIAVWLHQMRVSGARFDSGLCGFEQAHAWVDLRICAVEGRRLNDRYAVDQHAFHTVTSECRLVKVARSMIRSGSNTGDA